MSTKYHDQYQYLNGVRTRPLVRPRVRRLLYVLLAANAVVYGLPWLVTR